MVAVFLLKENDCLDMETETAYRVCKRLLNEEDDNHIRIFEIEGNKKLLVKDILNYKNYDVFVIINGVVFITNTGLKELIILVIKNKDLALIAPVSNECNMHFQKCAPPFLYQTITVFKWAVEEVYKIFKTKIVEVDTIDNFCFAFRKELLEELSPNDYLIDLPKKIEEKGFRSGIARGIYVHRYGNVYESGREDLLAYVPLKAKNILDIGCAKGLFGELLKRRQDCCVTGIEYNKTLADIANKRIDRVIVGDIEQLIEDKELGQYDCIICGDVLEHLNNPWKVVRCLKNNLNKGGTFIASVPNINNWAIIYDMLSGRWDYVPFSILSGTHLRFFTRQTLMEMFIDAGYSIKDVFYQSVGIPKEGEGFIKKLSRLRIPINKEELKASEIVIIAINI